ncbi:MAG: hypothetical protein MJ206_00975 [Bacilli bacterium]|nr:hypothetical protein [Bacilli bacterium]
MISLLLCFLVLFSGYAFYSRFISRAFKPDSRKTPAIAINDGVDCVPMSKPRLFLVQLLNIAGTGPIFGPIMGALFGPVVFLWIIFGTLLGGAVHDFMTGMISSRNDGASIAELSGAYVGRWLKYFMRAFSVVLLILCGAVFLLTPAQLLSTLTPLDYRFWIIIIILYYFLATMLPIDRIIGKLYPLFGVLLLLMAFCMFVGLFTSGNAQNMPEFWVVLTRSHPDGLPMWPCMFVTVACGAISGFHATQSPIAAKCLKSERQGRQIFYGGMVAEAVIALIWAAVGIACYTPGELWHFFEPGGGGAGAVVLDSSKMLLGTFGGILAIIGVIVCPITSGDTAFRSARLIVAESFHLDQKKIFNRLILTIPVVGAGVGLAIGLGDNFDVLWRYFAAANQTLAMITLWVASFYMLKKNQYKNVDLFVAIPAAFMVAGSMTYICVAKECFNAPLLVGYIVGSCLAVASFIAYLIYRYLYIKKHVELKARPHMAKHLKEEKIKSEKLIHDFKMELLLKKYYVVQERDFDNLILKALLAYKNEYEFLQELRVASSVEEILKLQEEIVASKKRDPRWWKRILNFCYVPVLRHRLLRKRFTARFKKRKPMNIGLYYQTFKYNMKYALKYGVIYTAKRGDWTNFVTVFPNNFQRIEHDTFFALPMKSYAFALGKSFELTRAIEFDDVRRFHLPDDIHEHYWYIYEFARHADEKVNNDLMKVLTDFMDEHHLKLYVDTLYNANQTFFKNFNFEAVVNETIDYAQVPHTVYIRTPQKG